MLCKPTVCTRPGGHHRQMEARSPVSRLMGYAYSHPISMGRGSVMGLRSLPGVLHTLKIINWSLLSLTSATSSFMMMSVSTFSFFPPLFPLSLTSVMSFPMTAVTSLWCPLQWWQWLPPCFWFLRLPSWWQQWLPPCIWLLLCPSWWRQSPQPPSFYRILLQWVLLSSLASAYCWLWWQQNRSPYNTWNECNRNTKCDTITKVLNSVSLQNTEHVNGQCHWSKV